MSRRFSYFPRYYFSSVRVPVGPWTGDPTVPTSVRAGTWSGRTREAGVECSDGVRCTRVRDTVPWGQDGVLGHKTDGRRNGVRVYKTGVS